jgi:hypothetical protein
LEYTTTDSKHSYYDGFTQSMFGTTEEVFFSNWDFGGYWEKKTMPAAKPTRHSTDDFGKNGTNLF